MNDSPKYDIPWDLISGSLSGGLTFEEEQQLQQWLTADPQNREKYAHIREMWMNGMEDYRFYKMANEQEAWKALHSKIGESHAVETKVIKGEFVHKPSMVRKIVAIAAVFIGLVGFGIWFASTRDNPVVYQTAENEQKKILLTDSSIVTLQPGTRIEVAHDYNQASRTIVMMAGEAYFDVRHFADKPFIVELGLTQVKDIGTSFTITKGKKEIIVEVSSGKVAFVKRITRETRELSAGTGITFDINKESFGEVKLIKSSSASNSQMMNFDDTPLFEVVDAIQKVYGKKVIVSDSNIVNKRFTAHLGGMSCEKTIEVICKSLGLEYTENDDVYVLKKRNVEQH